MSLHVASATAPWKAIAHKNQKGFTIRCAQGFAIAKINSSMAHLSEVKEANAHLMASAPELFEALEEAVATIRAFNGMGMDARTADSVWQAYQQSPEMQLINAALLKAQGGTK